MNYNQQNQYLQNSKNNTSKVKKTSKDLYPGTGYGSFGSSQQFNNNFNNNTNNNYPSQNYYYPNQTQINNNERPLWSYRETKYDENKMPMNTEEIEPPKIEKPLINSEMPKKADYELLKEKDKKYFNNNRYQKVKVTKKVKNSTIAPPPKVEVEVKKKGPEDDYEQQYNIQNNINDEQLNQQELEENKNNNFNYNNQINNFNNNNYEQNEENIDNNENMDNEDEEVEIELAKKNMENEYDRIIDDDNNKNYNNQNENNEEYEEEQKDEINDIQNQMERNEINDDELQNENYDLDVDNLAEADSDNENKNIPEKQENNDENQNNNMELNNQNRHRPTFNKIMTQKITDIIDNVKTFPEGNLESWNFVADYNP